MAIFSHPFSITTPWENGCDYFRAVFFGTEPDPWPIYQAVEIDSTKSRLYLQVCHRQTDRRTDGKAISIAHSLLRNPRENNTAIYVYM